MATIDGASIDALASSFGGDLIQPQVSATAPKRSSCATPAPFEWT
jgi:hypothetical protein